MKTLMTTIVLSLVLAGGTWAADEAKPLEVGNKICPVSGEKVGQMGEIVTYEHEGKVYNLCCTMCEKDFKKDPQKYIEKVNEELKASGEEKK